MEEYVNFECTHIADADQSTSDEHSALAYADIDGHPKDEDAAGAVICRVWMLKEKQGIYPTYLVNWNYNAYRMNKISAGTDNAGKGRFKEIQAADNRKLIQQSIRQI